MDAARKKELAVAYKNRRCVGGICCIRCSGNQRVRLQATKNIEGLKNRFEFSMATHTCPDPFFREEWAEYGADTFSFEVLEELKQGETQTDQEFSDDIDELYEMWLEKLGGTDDDVAPSDSEAPRDS